MNYEENIIDAYCETLSDDVITPIKSMKRADRRIKSNNKFKQRVSKTKRNLTKLEYDKTETNKPCEVPHRKNISALKNHPHAWCNIRINDHMNDIEKDHFNGSWDELDAMIEHQLQNDLFNY